MAALSREPVSPPVQSELIAGTGAGEDVIAFLIERGDLTRLNESVLFLTPVYERMVRTVVDETGKRGTITVAEVRDLLNTSRKYALALLEHLDERKVTRRVGDARVLY